MALSNRAQLLALLCAIALGPVVMVTKCVLDPDGDDFPKFDPRVSMSVALLTVGALPAERLHVYDPSNPFQPGVDELARVGITCHFAIAASDAEPAATVSILTGQLPSTHGVIGFDDALPQNGPTLARRLATRGFARGAFVNQPFFSQCDLDDGFDVAREELRADAKGLAAAAERWIASLGRRNFFLWVHCEADPTAADPRARDAVTVFDDLVAAVGDALKRTRWYEGTVIAAAGTRDERGGDLIVPLIFKIPMRQPMSARRTGPCSTLDISPTLLELLGMERGGGAPGRSLVTVPSGASPLFAGHYFVDRGTSERFEPGSKSPALGLRGPQFELIVGPKPGVVALFDRSKAKANQRDLAAERSETNKRVIDAMVAELFERKKRIPPAWAKRPAPPLPDETRAVIDSRAP